MRSVLGAYHGGPGRAREGILRRSPSYMGGPSRKTCTGTCNRWKIFFDSHLATDGGGGLPSRRGYGTIGQKGQKKARLGRAGDDMLFGETLFGKLLMTFFTATVPVVELRGPSPCRGPAPGPGLWWPTCWTSACGPPCPPSPWAWSSPGASSRR